jgi:hypothetical protein
MEGERGRGSDDSLSGNKLRSFVEFLVAEKRIRFCGGVGW